MRLSIIMPSYQQGPFIERAIRSVLDQGHEDLEFFVLDGGSTDETIPIIRRYQDRITRWRSHRDAGQTAAINEGLAWATGDVVAYLNSDDYYLPGALAVVSRWWENRSAASPKWLAGSADFVDEHAGSQGIWYPDPPPRDPVILLGHPWATPQPSSFWARELFGRLGPLRADLKYVMDAEWMVRLALAGEHPTLVPQTLSVRWLHAGAKSASTARFVEEFATAVVQQQPSISAAVRRRALRLLRLRVKRKTVTPPPGRCRRLWWDFVAYPPVAGEWLLRAFRRATGTRRRRAFSGPLLPLALDRPQERVEGGMNQGQ